MTAVQIFNQYSFLLLSAIALAIVAVVLTRQRARPIFWVVWGGVFVGVVAYALMSRVPQTATVKLDTAADIRIAIQTAGKPVLVEFYSNY
ncbi:MAG: hypothetical protein D6709_11695 [Chloroflexi bacterium]|jgi:drug/metabolite transporter superfamily protein YnfA|uniref:Uncharacterized protein n=1 Tax=Candidatus Thermofonsia Clade 3 bacterium TaxID=2364212 RepID=A0A2M8QFL9_9CHLR|nr:hypothetical protein [Candidatus Roseilinea sp. NK_OTU-006]PJF48591.1 MAG: hypothetical protein CUN48_02595 [Candidatus Thermofonsia Clade 3 bacterium]RMG62402.1 MAG: hypothetical protein D6709_11695 [Chloroflexota bacterium]